MTTAELAGSTQDLVSQSIVGVLIVAMFALLTIEKTHRVLVVLGTVAFIWLVTYLTPYHLLSFEATASSLDLNVLFLLAAMIVEYVRGKKK